jgi:hypothetical protein
MKSPLITGSIFALLWFGIRFGLAQFLEPAIAMKAGIMINILFVLLTIFFVFYFTKRKNGFQESAGLEDFKLCLKGGIIYVVLISITIYGYYSIDDSLFKQNMEVFEANLASKTKDDIIKEKNNNPETKGMTSETYILKSRENQNKMNSPGTEAMFSMLGLTVWCLFASLFCAFIFRKVLLSPKALGSK